MGRGFTRIGKGSVGHYVDMDLIAEELTQKVIGAFFEVSRILGSGFLEKVYERALVAELRLVGLSVSTQSRFEVGYKGQSVGDYVPDILVEDCLIVELKCVDSLRPEHAAQCMNYLRVSERPVCLLVNFQKARVEWRRIVLSR
jgi:GxxExxY protein